LVETNSVKKVGIGFISRDQTFVGRISIGEVFLEPDARKIFLSMEDSLGNAVLAPVLVNESYNFVFQAPKDDFYYWYLDNNNSDLGSSSHYNKMVFWQVFYYGNYTLIFQISAYLLWTNGAICIALYLFKNKRPTKIVKDNPTLAEKIIRKIIHRTKK